MSGEWLSRLPAPARRGLFFALQAALGSRIGPVWREFQAWERFRPAQLDEAVEARLGSLLEGAVTQSPRYRDLGLSRRAGESAVDFLRRFPTLSRAEVPEQFTRIVADPWREEITSPGAVARKRYDWLVVKTGGTTGVPTTVVHDAAMRDSGRATRLYAARQSGFPLGTPYLRLWGSEADLLNQKRALPQRVLSGLLGEIPLNAFRAREAELRAHHAVMMAHPEIRHLMTYVDAAVGFALFLRDRNLPGPRLKSIMSCAGTLLPEYRTLLQETFGAEVFDKYGSRDCADMACECSRHNGLHVCSPHVLLEIVDDSGAPCPPGRLGRILVTPLRNRVFPMIRYEVGDVGTWAEPGPCPCGSPFPRLHSVHGRADDMLVTEDGTWQSSVFVRHFVGVSLNRELIREWQLEQVDRTRFVFRYIPRQAAGLAENLQQIVDCFRRVFGPSAQIELQQVAEIPPSETGKVRWIINSYRR